MSNEVCFSLGIVLTLLALGAMILWDILSRRRREKIHSVGGKTLYEELLARPGCMEGLLFLMAYTVFSLYSNHQHTYYNNYSYLADAWLHGRLDVPELPSYLESVQFGGKTYVHFAPGPALLCLPFVALLGVDGFNSAFLCKVLGAANVALCWCMLRKSKLGDERSRLWMTGLLGFGTVHFWCASWGSSWLLGHLSTLFFLLIALCFLFQEEEKPLKDFLCGLFFGLAVCCRLSALLGGFFLAGTMLMKRKRKIRALLCLAGGAAVFGSLYMLYNYARFGTIMDESYSLTYLKDYHRESYDLLQEAPTDQQLALLKELSREFGGPLQTKFLSFNLQSLFLLMPEYSSEFPYVIPTQAGVSMILISPALLMAFLCEWKKPVTWLLWGTTLITAVPFLLNYGNGQAQFGMRYAMDFTPYLFLLSCMGMQKMKGWKKGLVLWSVLANAWGALYWKCFY